MGTAVQPEPCFVEGGRAGGCSEGTEVALGQGHGEGRVCGEVELGGALAPVFDDLLGQNWFAREERTAILTGAVVVD